MHPTTVGLRKKVLQDRAFSLFAQAWPETCRPVC